MLLVVDRIISCLLRGECQGVETMALCARIWLGSLYGIVFNSSSRCPVCGREFVRLYAHLTRSRCRAVLERLLERFVELYRESKHICVQLDDHTYCRICGAEHHGLRDCLEHVFSVHLSREGEFAFRGKQRSEKHINPQIASGRWRWVRKCPKM